MIGELIRSILEVAGSFLKGYLYILAVLVSILIMTYFLLLNFSYLFTIVVAFRSLKRYARRLKSIVIQDLVRVAGAPPVSLLAPAYNEEATCVEAIKSMMFLNYPDYEIIVINDGSQDRTLERMLNAFKMVKAVRAPTARLSTAEVKDIYRSTRYDNLYVIDKENGGKADALNAGLNYCRTPLFCAMDSDSLLEKDALIRIVRPFLEDETTVAAGGIIRIVNGCTVESGIVKKVRLPSNMLASFQVMEYLRAFLSGRMGWDALNANLIISGAFGIFRRSTAVTVGGYATDTVGEDMELAVKLHHYCSAHKIKYRIAFVPDPVAWTECPETVRILGHQRDRWQRGLYEVMTRHSKMMFRRKYGLVGMLAYPYFYFLEMLGPLIELPGYLFFFGAILLGRISFIFALSFLTVAFVFGTTLSIATVGLEELTFRRYTRFRDLLKLFGLAVIENFGYRQLTTFWRIRGMLGALRGKRRGWGKMERRGFTRQSKK